MGSDMKDEKLRKFKNLEKEFRTVLPERSIIGIRLDGKSFHTFTKQFKEPYDLNFMRAMDDTAKFILENVLTEALFAYVQSDEITIFFTDLLKPNAQIAFDGKVEKILSVSASAATGGFMTSMPTAKGVPIFDSRLFALKNFDELQEYLDWRRLDARKNAISMAAETLHTPKQLNGMSTTRRLESLEGTHLEKLPDNFFWGRLIIREEFEDTITLDFNKFLEPKTLSVTRNRWTTKAAFRDVTEDLVKGFEKDLLAIDF